MKKYINNLKIKKKLLTTFSIIILMVIIMAAAAIVSLITIKQKYSEFYSGPYQITNYSMDMRRNIQSYAKFIGYAMMTDDLEQTKDYLESSNDNIEALKEGYTYLMEHYRGDKTAVEQFNQIMVDIREAREKVSSLAGQNKNAEATALFFAEIQPNLLKAQEYLVEINDTAVTNADNDYNSVVRLVAIIFVIVIILIAAIVLITVYFAMIITKGLTVPVEEIESAAGRIAQGDFDANITYESADELGSLAESMRTLIKVTKEVIQDTSRSLEEVSGGNFNIAPAADYVGTYAEIKNSIKNIVQGLSHTMEQINETAEQVSMGSMQMAESAQGLAEGATEQAGAVEELTATITSVTESAESSAQNTYEAYKKTDEFKKEAESSKQEMQELLRAMERISETSKEIQNIIAEIEDIASQTNLLSLNASIEAARAGEAGKGFAVVADQIGKLASDSAASAVNTRNLINKTLDEIGKGNVITEQTAASIERVIEGINMLAQNSKETSDMSSAQAETMKQIEQGVEQISGVVQNNSAAAEETSATSEELSAQAENLKQQVSQFQLLEQ